MKITLIKICSSVLLMAGLHVHAQTDLPSKTRLLARSLEKKHYQPIQWNDSASAMLYNRWLHVLDDDKLFFTEKDIAALQVYKYKLDDEITGKEWNFFNTSINLYKKNLVKLDSLVKAYTSKPVDLTKPDQLVWPCTSYAATEKELFDRWQKYLKWSMLQDVAAIVADTNGVITATSIQPKWETEARAKTRKQELQFFARNLLDANSFKEEMEDDYLNAVAWCYDPHTTYMNEKKRNAFETQMSAAEYSVGLDMEENEEGDITISYLQPGGSAWRSGQLHTGDVIVKVKTEGKEREIKELSENELQSILHSNSEAGMEVTVRTKSGETKKVQLAKEKIDSEEAIVKSYLIRDKKNIGYINLPGFYSREDEEDFKKQGPNYDGCANDVSKEIVKLKKDSVAGLILDLRFNGGGSMWEAMQLAGIFIDIGPVASAKMKDGKTQFLKDPNRGTIYDGPLVVLINGGSASASEFLSAALQDYKRAVIVGSTTYGKGTAQQVLPLDTNVNQSNQYNEFVKVTNSKFYRINGSTVQWQGVVPDIELPDIYNDDSYKEKSNVSALQPDKNKAGIYETLPEPPIAALAAKSKSRVAANPYFTTVSNFAAWVKRTKQQRSIPLQWQGYAAMYNEGMKMYRAISDDDMNSTSINITNNNFDAAIINRSEQRKKEINGIYISHLKGDAVIEEACQILLDWAR